MHVNVKYVRIRSLMFRRIEVNAINFKFEKPRRRVGPGEIFLYNTGTIDRGL